jgi:hypothetical protein
VQGKLVNHTPVAQDLQEVWSNLVDRSFCTGWANSRFWANQKKEQGVILWKDIDVERAFRHSDLLDILAGDQVALAMYEANGSLDKPDWSCNQVLEGAKFMLHLATMDTGIRLEMSTWVEEAREEEKKKKLEQKKPDEGGDGSGGQGPSKGTQGGSAADKKGEEGKQHEDASMHTDGDSSQQHGSEPMELDLSPHSPPAHKAATPSTPAATPSTPAATPSSPAATPSTPAHTEAEQKGSSAAAASAPSAAAGAETEQQKGSSTGVSSQTKDSGKPLEPHRLTTSTGTLERANTLTLFGTYVQRPAKAM